LDTTERHLSSEEIEWLSERLGAKEPAEVTEGLEGARQHLASCDRCQKLVQMHDRVQRDFGWLKSSALIGTGEGCPSLEEWGHLLAGMLPETRAQELLEHCGVCDACGQRMRGFTEDFSDELSEEDRRALAGLESGKPGWQSAMARSMKALSDAHRHMPEPPIRVPAQLPGLWIRWAFACAVVVLLAAGVWIYRGFRGSSVDELLARAYTEQRTLELRMAGAAYAPLRQERGSARSSVAKPSALLKAEYLIKDELTVKPEDPILLGRKGKAELLEWQYDEAIRSLRHALDLQPGSPDLLCDLATAYAQRGDVESRPLDYGQAIEYLGQAISRKPDDAVLLFNRAVVEERLNLFEEAAKDWEHYLLIDPKGAWANEARQHLEAIRRRQKEGAAAPVAERDPAHAIQAFERGARENSASESGWPDSLDEDYLDVALTNWLPALSAPVAKGGRDITERPEWRALNAFSHILVAHHKDHWLEDMLLVSSKPSVMAGWKELGAATNLNIAGEFDEAAGAAQRAVRFFSSGRCLAGMLRALWEEAYALQRQQHGDLCFSVDERGRQMNRQTAYPWLAVQFDLEHSICSAMLGQLGSARTTAEKAVLLAESARYGTLTLRALQAAGTEVASEDPERSWALFAEGLKRHWAARYRPFRVYQFYAEMAYTPESRCQWHLAQTLMDEAVAHIARTSNRLTEAVARQSLAVDTQMAGDTRHAIEQFRRAANLFGSLPPSPTTRTFRFSAEVYEASLEVEDGETERALQTLRDARRDYSEQSQYWVWLHYYQALGDALLRHGGNVDKAERALWAAVYISEAALSTLKTDADRALWEQRTAGAYRSLVEAELQRNSAAEKVFELWEWYLSAPIRIPERHYREQPIDFSALETAPVLPVLSTVDSTISRLSDVTVISFADLKSHMLVWVFNRSGVQMVPLQVSRSTLEPVVRRFLRLCEDPTSDMADVRRTGSQLYDWLFAPIEDRLVSSRSLILELDGTLRPIPAEALVNRQGEFLGQRYELVVGPGLQFQEFLRRTSSFKPQDKVLVVGTSAARANFDLRLEPLPDSETEVRNISARFLHSTVLLGNEATFDALQRELPFVRVFHFAGHAIVSPTRTGLVLAPARKMTEKDGSPAEFLDASQIRKLAIPRADLVVLSACATAGDDGGVGDSQSLVRAFLRAGVPHVIATRWNVDSHSTSALMQEFYGRLLYGEQPAAALRSAAEVVRQNQGTAHPYYWAAFTAFGRD